MSPVLKRGAVLAAVMIAAFSLSLAGASAQPSAGAAKKHAKKCAKKKLAGAAKKHKRCKKKHHQTPAPTPTPPSPILATLTPASPGQFFLGVYDPAGDHICNYIFGGPDQCQASSGFGTTVTHRDAGAAP